MATIACWTLRIITGKQKYNKLAKFRRSVKAKIVKHYITGNDNLLNTVQRTAPLIIIFKINNRHGSGGNHSVFGKNCDEVKAVNTITGSPRPPLLLVNPPLNFRSDQADNRGGPTSKQNITGQSFPAKPLVFSALHTTEREMSSLIQTASQVSKRARSS